MLGRQNGHANSNCISQKTDGLLSGKDKESYLLISYAATQQSWCLLCYTSSSSGYSKPPQTRGIVDPWQCTPTYRQGDRPCCMMHSIGTHDHPPYSPDLAPSDFYIFSKMEHLAGKIHRWGPTTCCHVLNSQVAVRYKEGIRHLVTVQVPQCPRWLCGEIGEGVW